MQFFKRSFKRLVEDSAGIATEMVDSSSVVLKFIDKVPEETSNWLCKLIMKPSMFK